MSLALNTAWFNIYSICADFMSLPYICITKAPQLLQASGISCMTVRNAVPLLCVWSSPGWGGVLTCLGYFLLRTSAPTFPTLPLVSALNSTMLINSLQASLPYHMDTPSLCVPERWEHMFALQLRWLPLLLNVGKRVWKKDFCTAQETTWGKFANSLLPCLCYPFNCWIWSSVVSCFLVFNQR